jgi:hypothetical protein
MIAGFAGELKSHAIRVTVMMVVLVFSMIAGPLDR